MATETLLSTYITNRDATPRVTTDSHHAGAVLREAFGQVNVTTGMTSGSIYRMVQVPANARIREVIVTNPAHGASSAFDVGLYKTTVDGGAVVDADFFASALACTSANSGVDVTAESGVYTLDEYEKALWDAAGMSAAPASGYLDICLTNTATNAGTARIGVLVRYVV